MNGWKSYSRNNPCPICNGPDNCTRSSDGKFAYCGRVSEGSIRQNNGGQFLHRLDGSSDGIDWLAANPVRPTVATHKPTTSSTQDWEQIARNAFNSPNAGLARQDLSNLLGVSVGSLERIGVGWLGRSRGWTVPERDATGKAIGINRRLLNGAKRREKGCKAGLTFDPVRWMDPDESIFDIHLVEGASDVAAMLTLGLCAIGRPSNLGGVELLGELLKTVPSDRRIAVIGERDRKPHASLPPATRDKHKADCPHCGVCWPGWFGATKTAERLAEILNREVLWSLTPEGFKDVREWLNKTEGMAEHGS